ncbi:MAG TPA: extracellular solute-binding protein [Spirochaetia bacterium]|nr:extracellular solute-binding protein [Spirochaetia bacterium]
MKRLLIIALVAMCLAPLAFAQVNTDLKGTLTCWTWTAKAIEFVTPEFQKMYPNINIDVTPMSHPDTHDKIFVAIASGSGAPDILTIDSAYIQKFIEQGGLVDMTSYISTVRNKFPAYKIANDSDANGRVFAVPFDCGPVGFYYQKGLVDKYKITLPTTWAEWMTLGKQLKAKGVYMNTVSVAAAAMDQSMHGEVGLHGLLVQQQGGAYFDSNLKPTLDSKESVAAMKLIKQMVDAGIAANVEQGSPAYYDMYNKGQVLGVMSAAWYVNVLNNFVTPDMAQFGNWRVAAMPAFVKGGVRASNLGGSECAIATQTPDSQQQMAMAFIKWVCASVDGARAHADYGEFPAFMPAWPTDIVQNKTFPVLGDQKVYKLFAQITPTVPPVWRIPPQYTQIQSILQAKMNDILTGKVTVEKGLAQAQAEALSK